MGNTYTIFASYFHVGVSDRVSRWDMCEWGGWELIWTLWLSAYVSRGVYNFHLPSGSERHTIAVCYSKFAGVFANASMSQLLEITVP